MTDPASYDRYNSGGSFSGIPQGAISERALNSSNLPGDVSASFTYRGRIAVEFQERVRTRFPLFEQITAAPLPEMPPEVAQFLLASIPASRMSYQFSTENRSTSLALTAQSLTLTTREYTRWENFSSVFIEAYDALIDIYRPSFISRLGLRYRDAIDKKNLGYGDVPWSALLRVEILGELSLGPAEKYAKAARRHLQLSIPGFGDIVLQHGLATIQPTGNVGYLIDFDFSSAKKTEVKDARGIIDSLHEGAGRAFRWCIQDTLDRALDPVPLNDGVEPGASS